jgi:aspartyl/glutamyl-tRNA(Asn/Gln) amidotransferase C subunit
MSDYYDIKKLCALSRIEIDESKIQQTTEKIKEIISFFNKLDEFELNEKDNNNNTYENFSQSITTSSSDNEAKINNYIKFEKKIDDLRTDEHDERLFIFKKDNDISHENKNNISLFSFRFHNNKNGYVIGPKI